MYILKTIYDHVENKRMYIILLQVVLTIYIEISSKVNNKQKNQVFNCIYKDVNNVKCLHNHNNKDQFIAV